MSKKNIDFKNFPLEKYKYVVIPEQKKVIAMTTYAGKLIKSYAVCTDGDQFDIEKGKKIAAYKCNLKVAERRLHNFYNSYNYTHYMIDYYARELGNLNGLIERASEAFNDAVKKLDEAVNE